MKPPTTPKRKQCTWVLEPGEDDTGERGTVVEPTQEQLDYLATCASSFRASVRGHLMVAWDGLGIELRGWTDPDELCEVCATCGQDCDPDRNIGPD